MTECKYCGHTDWDDFEECPVCGYSDEFDAIEWLIMLGII